MGAGWFTTELIFFVSIPHIPLIKFNLVYPFGDCCLRRLFLNSQNPNNDAIAKAEGAGSGMVMTKVSIDQRPVGISRRSKPVNSGPKLNV